jgi:hypothetical protein
MARKRPVVCRKCGGFARDVGRISHGGYCEVCSSIVVVEAREQLQARSGPAWDRWLLGTQLENERRRIEAGLD